MKSFGDWFNEHRNGPPSDDQPAPPPAGGGYPRSIMREMTGSPTPEGEDLTDTAGDVADPFPGRLAAFDQEIALREEVLDALVAGVGRLRRKFDNRAATIEGTRDALVNSGWPHAPALMMAVAVARLYEAGEKAA